MQGAVGQQILKRLHRASSELGMPGKRFWASCSVSIQRRLVQQGLAAAAALVVDEVAVELGVVGDDRGVADEVHQVDDDLGELRRVLDLVVGDAVDPDGVGAGSAARD